MNPVDRLAADIRNAVNTASHGNVNRFTGLDDIAKQLEMTDLELLQAAAHLAADEGWLRTNGGRVVVSVAITLEGRRLALGAAGRRERTKNRAATPALPRSSR